MLNAKQNDEKQIPKPDLQISPKDLAVFAPLLGSALSVVFDVGYFWGIDINFYTSFSLAEHIVFALQATPFALCIALAIVVGIVISDRAIRRMSVALGPLPSLDSKYPQKTLSELDRHIAKLRRWLLVSVSISSIAASLIGAIAWHLDYASVAIASAAMVLFSLALLILQTDLIRANLIIIAYWTVVASLCVVYWVEISL